MNTHTPMPGTADIAKDRADWLLDAIACATQDRRFLRGDPEYDEVVGEAILLNGEKAILTAFAPRRHCECPAMTDNPRLPIQERLLAFELFLRGQGDLDGLWFGDSITMQNGRKAPYWWRRSHLTAIPEAAETIGELVEALSDLHASIVAAFPELAGTVAVLKAQVTLERVHQP